MRRLLLFLLLLPLLLSGCGDKQIPATDLLADLLSEVTPPAADIFFAGGAEEARLDTILMPLYGTTSDTLLRLSDYAVLLGRGTTLYEIHILRARSVSDIPTLRQMLETRAHLLCLSTEEGHPTERAAIVCERGTLLYLFATPDNARLRQAASS